MKYKFGSLVKGLNDDKVDIDYYKEGGVVNDRRLDRLISAAKVQMMQEGGNVARTPEEFKLGILAGKTVFPFGKAGPKPMTMKTPVGTVPYPIEYKGFTNNQLTDYGVAMPGDDFIVEGDTVVENKLYDNKYMYPNKKYMMKGGRIYKMGGRIMQTGGYNDPNVAKVQEHLMKSNQEASEQRMSDLPRPYTTRMDPNSEARLKSYYGDQYNDLSRDFNESELTEMMGNTVEVTPNTNSDLQEYFGPEFNDLMGSFSTEELRAMMQDDLANRGAATPSNVLPPPNVRQDPNLPLDEQRANTMYEQEFLPPNHNYKTRQIADQQFDASFNNPWAIKTEDDNLGTRQWSQRNDFTTDLAVTEDITTDLTQGPKTDVKGSPATDTRDLSKNLLRLGVADADGRLNAAATNLIESTLGPEYKISNLNASSGFNTAEQTVYRSVLENAKALNPGLINTLDGIENSMRNSNITNANQLDQFLNTPMPNSNMNRAQYMESYYGISPAETKQIMGDMLGVNPNGNTRYDLFRSNVRARADYNGLLQMAAMSNGETLREAHNSPEKARKHTEAAAKTINNLVTTAKNEYINQGSTNTTLLGAALVGMQSLNSPGVNSALSTLRMFQPAPTANNPINPRQADAMAVNNFITMQENAGINRPYQMKYNYNVSVLDPIMDEYTRQQNNYEQMVRGGAPQVQLDAQKRLLESSIDAVLQATALGSKIENALLTNRKYADDEYVVERRNDANAKSNNSLNNYGSNINSDYDLLLASFHNKKRNVGKGTGMYMGKPEFDYEAFAKERNTPANDGYGGTRYNMYDERFRPVTTPGSPGGLVSTPGTQLPPPQSRVSVNRSSRPSVPRTTPPTNRPTPPTQGNYTRRPTTRTTGSVTANVPANNGVNRTMFQDRSTKRSPQASASGATARPRTVNPALNHMMIQRKEGGMIYNTGQTIKYKSGGTIKTGVIKRYNPNTNEIELY